jgi:uridine phosphorylase
MIAPHLLVSEGEVARFALLPGDPGRAKLIAEFLESPVKLSENREFVVYNGFYKGLQVTVCSTGIGGPSAAIAVEELARCGTRVFVRVGTCGALVKGIGPGEIIVPYASVRLDGTSTRYVDPRYPATAHPRVVSSLVESLRRIGRSYKLGIVLSDDRFYSDK